MFFLLACVLPGIISSFQVNLQEAKTCTSHETFPTSQFSHQKIVSNSCKNIDHAICSYFTSILLMTEWYWLSVTLQNRSIGSGKGSWHLPQNVINLNGNTMLLKSVCSSSIYITGNLAFSLVVHQFSLLLIFFLNLVYWLAEITMNFQNLVTYSFCEESLGVHVSVW